MKRSSGFNNKNKYQGRLKRLFFHTFLILFLFITNSHSYAEEFVSFSKDNAKFKIEMPSLSPNRIDKIDHVEFINNSIVFNVFNFKQLTEALDNATGGEVIVVRSNLRDKRYHYKQKHRFERPVFIFGLLNGNQAPFFDNVTWENLHNVTLSHFKVK